MVIGNGWAGPVPQAREWYQKHDHQPLVFVEQIQPHAIVILKRPHRRQLEILAMGHVAGGYEHLEQFEDV